MAERNFCKLLKAKWDEGKFVCIGLDSDFGKIPESARVGDNECDIHESNTIVAFNRAIVEATKDLVCAYKPNTAFYEAYGAEGITALHRTIADIRAIASDVPVILDAKRADIGNTNAGYVNAAFGFLRADAITVHPYLGAEALQPFLEQTEKGVIVLCRTSNPGAGEFQDLSVAGEPLYRFVARQVASEWNKNGNCALVVGATYPDELSEVRKLVGNMPILIPGIGAQGADVEKAVLAGVDNRNQGIIINSSRGIIFASSGPDYPEAARVKTIELQDQIDMALGKARR